MTSDERIDLPETAWRAELLKEVLNYPIGADRILSVGRRWPVEIVTLRHHAFPPIVCFDVQIIREARALAAEGARVRLSIDVSRDGRTTSLIGVERV